MALREHTGNDTDGEMYDVVIASSALPEALELTFASKAVAEEVAAAVLAAAEARSTVRIPFSRFDTSRLVDEGTVVLDFANVARTQVRVSEHDSGQGNQPGTVRR
ncbi:MAG: hypothetical protein WCC60_08180 [Ilumatobacteraceae bacterium]